MAKRKLSKAQRLWLVEEIELWRTQGIVNTEQSTQILRMYETADQAASEDHSRNTGLLMSLAAVLVSLAALLLIGYNWQAMPAWLKLLLVLGTVAGTHLLAFQLRYRQGAKVFSETAAFLACLFYGCGIALIAQIFHLNGHYPDALWWWAVGTLPFALLLETPLLHLLLVSLLGVWAGIEVLEFQNLGGWLFGRRSFLPNGAYSLILLAAPGMAWAYRRGSQVTVGLYSLLLGWWCLLQTIAWNTRSEGFLVFLAGGLGATWLVVAECHNRGSRLAIPHRVLGVLTTSVVLLLMSFYEFNKELVRRTDSFAALWQLLIPVVLSVLFIGATNWYRRHTNPEKAASQQLTDSLQRQWLPGAILVAMVGLGFLNLVLHSLGGETIPALLTTVLANLGMLAFAVWLMRIGLDEDRGRPFAAGVLYFLLWSMVRYIDLFGDFGGMLGASLMFFLCGAVLFGVGLYWRKRKEIVHD